MVKLTTTDATVRQARGNCGVAELSRGTPREQRVKKDSRKNERLCREWNAVRAVVEMEDVGRCLRVTYLLK